MVVGAVVVVVAVVPEVVVVVVVAWNCVCGCGVRRGLRLLRCCVHGRGRCH